MTTVPLNLHNAGLLPLSIVIVAMGIALGSLAQIIASIRETPSPAPRSPRIACSGGPW
jgi:succinate-acetate transporter protein